MVKSLSAIFCASAKSPRIFFVIRPEQEPRPASPKIGDYAVRSFLPALCERSLVLSIALAAVVFAAAATSSILSSVLLFKSLIMSLLMENVIRMPGTVGYGTAQINSNGVAILTIRNGTATRRRAGATPADDIPKAEIRNSSGAWSRFAVCKGQFTTRWGYRLPSGRRAHTGYPPAMREERTALLMIPTGCVSDSSVGKTEQKSEIV